MVPITFSGLGVREGVFILLMSNIGVDTAITATVSVIAITIYYLAVIPILVHMSMSKARR